MTASAASRPLLAGEAHLGEGDGEAAVGAVVAGGGDALADGARTARWTRASSPRSMVSAAADEAVHLLQVLAAAERRRRAARRASRGGRRRRLRRSNAMRRCAGDVVEDAEHADDGRRVDGAPLGLVVEADVAGDDGRAELVAGVGDAADDFLHLEVDVGALGVAEVEAVGDGDGHGRRRRRRCAPPRRRRSRRRRRGRCGSSGRCRRW